MNGAHCVRRSSQLRVKWARNLLYAYAMRGYIALTPQALSEFLSGGTYLSESAFVTTRYFYAEFPDVDEEEREFELSLLAANRSRELQGAGVKFGLVLAVNLKGAQTGVESDATIALLSEISWDQVDSLLVSESDEEELTWYACQEIADNLASWLG